MHEQAPSSTGIHHAGTPHVACVTGFDELTNWIEESSAEVPVEEGLAEIDTIVAQNRQTRL